MGHVVIGLAARLVDFLTGSRRDQAAGVHLHWDREVRNWSETRPGRR